MNRREIIFDILQLVVDVDQDYHKAYTSGVLLSSCKLAMVVWTLKMVRQTLKQFKVTNMKPWSVDSVHFLVASYYLRIVL